MNQHYSHKRRFDLEALRGIAAIIVLIHHSLLAFAPTLSGFLPTSRNQESWVGSPFFGLVNGTAAVFFFFVLSGYVLTVDFLQRGDLHVLRKNFLKRLPRLFVPIFLSCFLAYICMKLNWLYCIDAAKINQSTWLKGIGFSHSLENFQPAFNKVVTDSLSSLLIGSNKYNSSLWTMYPEMLGGYLVMLLAFFYRQVLQMRSLILISIIIFILFSHAINFIYAFLIGFYIAILQTKNKLKTISKTTSWLFFSIGFYGLGYMEIGDMYYWLNRSNIDPYYVYTISSGLIIFSVVFCQSGYKILANPVGQLLGSYSFPVYLLHTTVIGSLGSFVYLKLYNSYQPHATLLITLLVTLFGVWFFSWLLLKIDTPWVNYLNKKLN